MLDKMKTNKFLKISWRKLERDCLKLSQKLLNKKITRIVAISRGGVVISRILSDLLSVPISHITIESYQNLKQEKTPIITEFPAKTFQNETLLIVDEICDSGKTFQRAVSYFKKFSKVKIYTLALYLKPKTKFIPDFWQEKVDSWIIFPYELKETIKAFTKMYANKNKIIKKLQEVGFKTWEIDKVIA